MKKQRGFSLIGILLIIGALAITASGVVVWKDRSFPRPTPFPNLIPGLQIITQITTNPRQTNTEATICTNTEGCSPYCGGCATCPKVPLSPGQKVNIKNTTFSLILLKITPSDQGYSARQATIELEVKSGTKTEKVIFQTPGFGTLECGSHRVKDIFGFRILLGSVGPDKIELQVWKL